MKIVIFGLSITSSWGNGHASTFRALCNALHQRGHRLTFFEHNVEWYQNNRDLPEPGYCEVKIFEDWDDIILQVRAALREADVAVAGYVLGSSWLEHGPFRSFSGPGRSRVG